MFRLFGGKHPEFTIEINRADAVYYPGDTVRAIVTLASEREAKFDEITIELLCEERFRTRDGDIADDDASAWHTLPRPAARETIARDGTLPAKYRQTYEFAWQIPAQVTASYNGELAQVRWMVRAEMTRAGAKSIVRDAPLGVVVAPPNHFVRPGEFIEDNPAARFLDVKFELPKLEFVQNEDVAGRVLLAARERFAPEALRLELVRTEFVSAAAGGITRRVVEATQELAGDTALASLDAGGSLAFDFRLQVPPKWCPSYRTASGYAIWQLQLTIRPRPATGAIAQGETPEARATQSLLIFNGYRDADAADPATPAVQNFAQDFAADQGFAANQNSAAPGSAELFAPPVTEQTPEPLRPNDSDRLSSAAFGEQRSAAPFVRETPPDAVGSFGGDFPGRNLSSPVSNDPAPFSRDPAPFVAPSPNANPASSPRDATPPGTTPARDTAEPLAAKPGVPTTKRRFCTNCGTPMPYEANFCPACGTPVHRGEGYY